MGRLRCYIATLVLTTVTTILLIPLAKYAFLDEYEAWPSLSERVDLKRRNITWNISHASVPTGSTTTRGVASSKTTATEQANFTRAISNAATSSQLTSSSFVTARTIIAKPRPPLIALWQYPFGKRGYGPREGQHCGCKYTYNRSMLMESDAVVLYCRDADKSNLPPDFPNRTLTQKYVWWCLEPPTHLKNWNIDLGYRRGFFNLTMTVRQDSDITVGWGFIDDVKSNLKKRNVSIESIVRGKNKTAIAIASNCGSGAFGAARARIKIFKEMMQKGLDMDTYGQCFENTRIDQGKLFSQLRYYKFHMSFENSYHCRDYVTEKFWTKAMYAGLVPVVWGPRREDYEAIAPNSSFIFVEDFESIDKLVEYLQFLDKNDTAYSQYFRWRSIENLKDVSHAERDPPISSDFMNGCELCRFLLRKQDSKDSSVSVVDSIEDYYNDPNDKDCFRSPGKNESYWKYAT